MASHASFRTRLFLFFLLVIAVALLLPTWYSRFVLGQEVQRASMERVMGQLRLTAGFVEHDLTFSGREPLRSWLARTGDRLGARLDYLTLDEAAERGGDVSHRAVEAGQAMAIEGSGENGRTVVAALRLDPAGPAPEGVLTLSTPHTGPRDRSGRVLGNILLGVLLTFLLAVPLSYFLSRQLSRSIRALSVVAKGIGSGDYDKRIRHAPGKEFDPLVTSINSMAESIQTQVRTITSQKSQLEAVLDSMKEGVMVLDEQGRLASINRALGRIFPGVDQFIGRRVIEAVVDSELHKACGRAVSQEGRGNPPILLQLEPERGRVYDVSVVSLAGTGSGLGAVVVFHDISKLTQLERVRRDFVANVSHELRTPLTSIKGYSETLASSANLGEAEQRFLDIIHRNADHMTKIVGDLLALSRLEAGQQVMEFGPTDLREVLAAAFDECAPVADGKGVELVLECEEPLRVRADFDRLVQVARNLMENAVRYSPEGKPVRVRCRAESGQAVVGVTDLGPGIPKEEQSRVFERFYRVGRDKAKSQGSSGLGLAISRHIIERHQGRLFLQSPPHGEERGATFYFSVPLLNRNTDDTIQNHNHAARK
ncbi:HAMP domain-containing sensor histidine kinase [Desulfohalovibrio reitneri]|uniref:HAMP domain-containing sensor histidine kinase n=1 Tax=Desulfohalovibrio reitneri TaxID=1307759 RepID=UPI00068A5018|nr:HAMP domain-containing sensor histidine kinase [Desulfohalovibrio reitneri]